MSSDTGVRRRLVETWLAPTYLVACVILGGASAAGFVANAALQLCGLLVIGLLLIDGVLARDEALSRVFLMRVPLLISGLAAAFLIVSILPLPTGVWARLPGREPIARGYDLLLMARPSLPLSLSAEGTVRALLALIPPMAMLLSALAASSVGRRLALVALVTLALLSIMLGLLQQFTGYDSPYYIYEVTSRGGAVGFFANRNHLATLSLMAMPLLAAFAADPAGGAGPAGWLDRRPLILGLLLFLLLGAVIVRSLAGWLLLGPVLLGCALIVPRRASGAWVRLAVPAMLVLAVLGVSAALFAPLRPADLDRTFGEIHPNERRQSMALTYRAVLDHLPLGSGFGSFELLYPRYEPPEQASPVFVNHAHDDYLELLLEGGVVGMILVAGFIAWWGARTMRIWRARDADPVARAASLAVGVVLAHSLVDYPVRTSAVAAAAAFCCVLMVAPTERRRQRRHLPETSRTISLARPSVIPLRPHRA